MNYSNKLSINRIIKPDLSVTEFIHFAAESGFSKVELRNDLEDPRVLGDEKADDILASCKREGVKILTINALQRFNDPLLFSSKKEELFSLIREAKSVGCSQIVLCPVNDLKDRRSAARQKSDLVEALKNYAPLLAEEGIIGLIEPLGFSICSVRYKEQAVNAIKESGYTQLYRLVHDTFHHYLSGETQVFGEWTGLVHISGVYAGKSMEDISDDDRVLVDREDIMNNKAQIRQLLDSGYTEPISYEPFSPVLQKQSVSELKKNLAASNNFLFS